MSRMCMLAALALCLLQPGCSSDEGACERIVEACHDADTGSGKPHECHEFAEEASATDEACADREDDCLEACGE
jgi:hypothetical protein